MKEFINQNKDAILFILGIITGLNLYHILRTGKEFIKIYKER